MSDDRDGLSILLRQAEAEKAEPSKPAGCPRCGSTETKQAGDCPAGNWWTACAGCGLRLELYYKFTGKPAGWAVRAAEESRNKGVHVMGWAEPFTVEDAARIIERESPVAELEARLKSAVDYGDYLGRTVAELCEALEVLVEQVSHHVLNDKRVDAVTRRVLAKIAQQAESALRKARTP